MSLPTKAFIVKFPGTPEGKSEAETFAAKLQTAYETRTGIKGGQWCEITLERRHPNLHIEKLSEYEVPVDKWVYEEGIEELQKRETILTATVAAMRAENELLKGMAEA